MSAEGSPAKDRTEAETEELKVPQLADLEQHISQRISQLAESGGGQETDFLLEIEAAKKAQSEAAFLPPFEPFEDFDFPALHQGEAGLASAYQEVASVYKGNAELLQSIHDLSDLVTDAVRQLNIRLNALEERAVGLSDGGDEEAKSLREIKLLLVEAIRRLDKPPDSLPTINIEGDIKASDIFTEVQRHVSQLEERIDKASQDVRGRFDERQTYLREQVEIRFKVLEAMAKESREYLNKHFFNLAVLIIILMFIAGALLVNSQDKMTNYLTQSMDTLRGALDQITLPAGGERHRGESIPEGRR